jgi:cytochrome c oxidase subunit 2
VSVTAGELYVPENTPVAIELTSADVIHSFWIPRWGGKVDNLPGETNSHPVYDHANK